MVAIVENRPRDKLRDLALGGDWNALDAMLKGFPAIAAVRVLLRLDEKDQQRLPSTLDPSGAVGRSAIPTRSLSGAEAVRGSS